MPGLDTDIEGEQRQRNIALRQADVRQRAGEAEPVQQAEGKSDQPRPLRRQARRPRSDRMISQASRRMLSAIVASTGGPGTWTDMVAGHKIDEAAVTAFADDAVIIIAHNSGFDRKFAERYWPIFQRKLGDVRRRRWNGGSTASKVRA